MVEGVVYHGRAKNKSACKQYHIGFIAKVGSCNHKLNRVGSSLSSEHAGMDLGHVWVTLHSVDPAWIKKSGFCRPCLLLLEERFGFHWVSRTNVVMTSNSLYSFCSTYPFFLLHPAFLLLLPPRLTLSSTSSQECRWSSFSLP